MVTPTSVIQSVTVEMEKMMRAYRTEGRGFGVICIWQQLKVLQERNNLTVMVFRVAVAVEGSRKVGAG